MEQNKHKLILNSMHLETNLSKIKQIAAKREDENFRFRAFLKNRDGKEIDSIVHRLHAKIVPLIDCTSCRNCCYCMKPKMSMEDITRLAQLENISSEEYIDDYCEKEFGDIYLADMPCRYIEENECRIYEDRPIQCKKFPYTNQTGFTSRLLGMISFYEVCPIVFNLMEELKDETRFYRKRNF